MFVAEGPVVVRLPQLGEIDGRFGSATKTAMVNFQTKWMGLKYVDGAAGKDTFTAASGHAPFAHGYGLATDNGSGVTTYVGSKHSFNLWRNGDGNYDFYDSSGVVRSAGYNYLTCS
ncbi:peptidoglycan-binding protein [Streptomyces sp. NPDC056160]|uniref:peptidoglycan-binding domain-containing protein n=1 Tax=Streptomyces sp. NPDC056160 TaxID=3345731 RepID=UPI0035E347A7